MKRGKPLLQRMLYHALARVRYGELRLTAPDGKTSHFIGKEEGPRADITIRDWKVMRNILSRGDVGLGEDYIEGLWDTGDLVKLLTFATLNAGELERYFHGNFFCRLLYALTYWRRRNTRKGSRRNIQAHYDVGNEFYALWLDQTMTYSAALFEGESERPLEQAQRAKYRRILEKLGPEQRHILEIGCGWGAFAEIAAGCGHSVRSLTISPAQHAFALERLRQWRECNKVDVHLEDYRDTGGLFDAIVSIEMFEAVGERFWPDYFQKIRQSLKKGGKAIIQTITIADHEFEGYRKRGDFIRHYTFPGGMLPSVARFREEAHIAGLKCKEIFSFGQDYAHTLMHWLHRFESRRDAIMALGYDEAFIRNWRFYLAYCIAAFTAGRTNVVQVELEHA